MVHTLPPWSSKYRMATAFGQTDPGELAARLGSIVTHDRRGNVVWLDDFEASVLKWQTDLGGTNAAAALSTTSARNGSQSVKLTTGDAKDDHALIYKYFQRPVMKRLGLEFSTTINANTKYIIGTIWVQYRGNLYYGRIWLHVASSKVYYSDVGGIERVLDSSFGFKTSDYTWYTLKIVIDLDTNEYVRTILDGKTYDMSDIALHTASGTAVWFLALQIKHTTYTDANNSVYVDDVILTQNEP